MSEAFPDNLASSREVFLLYWSRSILPSFASELLAMFPSSMQLGNFSKLLGDLTHSQRCKHTLLSPYVSFCTFQGWKRSQSWLIIVWRQKLNDNGFCKLLCLSCFYPEFIYLSCLSFWLLMTFLSLWRFKVTIKHLWALGSDSLFPSETGSDGEGLLINLQNSQ